MQSAAHPTEPLASIERHLVDLEYTIERQSIAIARLQDELADANRRADWYRRPVQRDDAHPGARHA